MDFLTNYQDLRKVILVATSGLFGSWWLYSSIYASQGQLGSNHVEKEQLVGHVTHLVIYPMRSAKGIKINSAFARESGLYWDDIGDRTFRLIDAKNGVWLSCKLIPKLLKINLEVIENFIEITVQGEKSTKLEINLQDYQDPTVDQVDCGDEVAKWFSNFLEKDCRLIYTSDGIQNSARYQHDKWRFQDSQPFHLLSTDSVEAINTAVESKNYTYDNFRPNIVVKALNGQPWDEDNWTGFLRIGGAKFAMTCQTPRCTVTSIDLKTFIRDATMEPLKTLKTFRQPKGDALQYTQKKNMKHAMVGIGLVIVESGQIKIGDEIFLTRY